MTLTQQEQTVTLRKIRSIRSHVGLSRFYAECDEGLDGVGIIGSIPRQEGIPSPYAYSPTKPVYSYQGRPIVVYETSHKVYDIFEVRGPIGPVDA